MVPQQQNESEVALEKQETEATYCWPSGIILLCTRHPFLHHQHTSSAEVNLPLLLISEVFKFKMLSFMYEVLQAYSKRKKDNVSRSYTMHYYIA